MAKKISSLLLMFSLAIIFALPVQAAPNLKNAFGSGSALETVGNGSGFNTNQTTVDPIIGNIISVVLSFLGVIFLILMVYGGYTWMTAMGSEEKVKKAQQMIQAAVLGLIVVVVAYAVTVFVLDRFSKSLLSDGASSGSAYNTTGGSGGSNNPTTSGACCANDGKGTCTENVTDAAACTSSWQAAASFHAGKKCSEAGCK